MRWSLLVFCALLAIPSSALADEAKADVMVIHLTGNKSLRGSVVEIVPNQHYVIVRPDGMTLKIPWSAVRAVLPPDAPAPPPEAIVEEKRSEAPPSSPRPSNDTPAAFVEIKSPNRIQLQWSGDDGKWVTACMSPCNRALPVDGSYRIVDARGRPGQPFQLEHDGKVTIRATPRSVGLDAIGIVLIAAGTISLYGGALAADEARRNDSAPGVAMLFGLSGIAVGTIMLVLNKSSVQVDQGSTNVARSTPKHGVRLDPHGAGLTLRF